MDRVEGHAVHQYGEGEPVILFGHGIGGYQGQWAPLVEQFSRSHRVVTFALAGSTDAGPALFSPIRHASLLGFADDLSLLVAQLGIRGAVYVGHSLSAMAGALAAAADPGLFSRLILINGSARYLHDPEDGYAGAFSQEEVDALLLAVAGDFTAWASGFAELAMGNSDRPELATEFARSLRSYHPDIALTMCRAAFTSDFRAVLPRVLPPALVLQSTSDPAVSLEAAQWLARALPHGEFRLLSSTGHFPHVVDPGEVIAAMKTFGLESAR